MSQREVQGVKGLEGTRQGRSPYMAVEMGWGESLVEVGDRVVVVAGRERGRVGVVSEVRKGQGECVVEELNLVSILFFFFLYFDERGCCLDGWVG